MKSNEFITEDFEEMPNELVHQIRRIKTHCQPFLEQSNGNFLWRGLRGGGNYINKDIRLDNRRPTDTPGRLHKKFNDYFTKEFGAPFRNAMFTSGNPKLVDDYGRVYAVFPEGDFKFLWSDSVADLFGKWQETYKPDYRHGESAEDSQERLTTAENKFMKKHMMTGYYDNNMDAAIHSGNEIMVRSAGYYGISRHIIERYFEQIVGAFNE